MLPFLKKLQELDFCHLEVVAVLRNLASFLLLCCNELLSRLLSLQSWMLSHILLEQYNFLECFYCQMQFLVFIFNIKLFFPR